MEGRDHIMEENRSSSPQCERTYGMESQQEVALRHGQEIPLRRPGER